MAEVSARAARPNRGQPPTLRALTIRPPWAWAAIYGGKDVENRSWRTAYRGPLLIHASLRPDPDPEVAARLLWTMSDPEAYGRPRAAWQARRAIIGVAFLADIMTDSASPWAVPGCFHWKLEFPSPVDPPFPCPGRLGLWVPPTAVADALSDVL